LHTYILISLEVSIGLFKMRSAGAIPSPFSSSLRLEAMVERSYPTYYMGYQNII
jgi:hypothetical protein